MAARSTTELWRTRRARSSGDMFDVSVTVSESMALARPFWGLAVLLLRAGVDVPDGVERVVEDWPAGAESWPPKVRFDTDCAE